MSCPPSHREGVADSGREAKSPGASQCPLPLTAQPGAPRLLKPKDHLPGLAKRSCSRYPTSVTDEAENQGRGPQVPEWELGDTVNAGAQLQSFPSPSCPSRHRVPWTAAPSLWAQRPSGRQTPWFPSPTLTLQVLSASVSSTGIFPTNYHPAKPLAEFHTLSTLQA